MNLDHIKALCIEFNNVRNELRLTVSKENLLALRSALSAAQYGITMLCEDFKPGTFCVRAI